MLFNELTAGSEMARRIEFVSEGVANARWLAQRATGTIRSCASRLAHAAGKALVTAGVRLGREPRFGSARS